MNSKSFEKELPEGYELSYYINAKNARFGIIFNLIAILVFVLVFYTSISLFKLFIKLPENAVGLFFFGLLLGMILMLVYIILHELVHGVAYKKMTGERLTFGISWSCAFCGVPDIYVYRKCSMIASAAPLVLFTVLILPIMTACVITAAFAVSSIAVSVIIYVALSTLLAMHLGGCAGDIYVLLLLSLKFKDKNTLIRDTGPEQYIYTKKD